MDKPTKPTNLMPRSFGGIKNNWTASMQSSGYEDGVPAIYGGDNLNYQLDATGKELDYCETICDFINGLPIGKTITTDANNKLVYVNLAQDVPIATTETVGVVKPDGETITIDNDGTIHGASQGANKDLSNLSEEGNDRLHALKGYEDAGELLTDTEGLADVTKYAHSTFDRSKFTVVGSPNITDDGIASGFSNSNYLKYIFSTSISGTKSYDIYGSFTLNSAISSNEYIFYKIGNAGMSLYINSSGQLGFNTGVNANNTYHTVQLNEKYYYHISYNGTNVKFYYGTNKSNLTEVSLVSGGALTEVDWNTIGLGSAIGYFGFVSGSIDLKQFSITVDGVPVFSGNKTGIDTIKADNYTVVGTPTISADGIASGFSDSNYLAIPNIELGNYTNWTLTFVGKLPASASTFYDLGNANSAIRCGCLYGNSNYILRLEFTDNTTDNNFIDISQYYGQDYTGTLTFTGSKYIITLTFSGGTKTIELTSSKAVKNQTIPFGYKTLLTSIDLNTYKVYSNNNLVYQPCLKIPYTLSKTGSKIVDSIYRDRVNDMYSQFGYAPYYTLSDTDFTIPQGEIYGYIEKTKHNIGEPIICLSSTLNDGEIWLEGATVSRSTYANLFAIYGTIYGAGDGTTTFALPNFKNRTLWGADSFGYIAAGLPNIKGNLYLTQSAYLSGSGAFSIGGSGVFGSATAYLSPNEAYFNAANSNSIYSDNVNTVQPPSIKVRVKTRYK